MSSGVLSQSALKCDLEWNYGDPVSLAFLWPGEDLTGTYRAVVRNEEVDGDVVCELTVGTAYDSAEGTTFTLQRASSFDVPIGNYWWGLTEVNGVTRLYGRVFVLDGRQAMITFTEVLDTEIAVDIEIEEAVA